MSKKRYGYYSPTAENRCGYKVYLDAGGKHVHVTAVFDDMESAEKMYNFPDKIYVGEVYGYHSGQWMED